MNASKQKKGVLLVNLGTPDSPSRKDVYKYLKQFLLDPRVIDISWLARNILVRGIIAPFRSKESSELYQQLWTDKGSPLKHYGEELTSMLMNELSEEYEIELAMRYQSPSIESGLEKLRDKKVKSILVLPLFPHYASASTGSVQEEVMRICKDWLIIPPINFISSYHDNPHLVQVFADNARKMDYEKYEHYIFSFHGIPQRQLRKADRCDHCLKTEDCCQSLTENNFMCYSAQCYDTAKLIAKELDLKEENYTVSFQSRLGKDPWTEPFTPNVIEALQNKGIKKLLVFSPAFVADCLETIIEIGYEYHEEFIEAGGESLDLVPSLNTNPQWVEGLKSMILANT